MAKFSGPSKAPVRRRSPVTTTGRSGSAPDTVTHQGGAGWSRDPKSDLFLLGVTNMVGEDTFYEAATDRDNRFRQLVTQTTLMDPEWVASLVPFLRNTMNMRSASTVGSAEYALAFRHSRNELAVDVAQGSPTVRRVIDSALQRADEPAEFTGYWLERTGSKTFPGGVQRGVQDSVRRLYTERNALKYDGGSRGVRMADVIELTHTAPKDARQAELFKWLLERRHNRTESHVDYSKLPMISARMELEKMPVERRREYLEQGLVGVLFAQAGMTWEALSGWLQGPMDRRAWETMIPNMGYMALLRNLRNFDDKGVGDDVAAQVATKLSNPTEVARSRQFPMRFLSAYRAAPSLRWAYPLEQALNLSLENVPELKGRTEIYVDRSQSMDAPLSKRSTLNRADAAAVFGSALAQRSEKGTLIQFGSTSHQMEYRKGESVLRMIERFGDLGGTKTGQAIRSHHRPDADRVIVLTDEQAGSTYWGWGESADPYETISEKTPVYTFNLAGYAPASSPSGDANRVTIGGLTDAAFRLIPLIEKGRDAAWGDLFASTADSLSSGSDEE